jgi:hypothetical protein
MSIFQTVVFNEFFSRSGLSGNDPVVVEGMHQNSPGLFYDGLYPGFAGVKRWFALNHLSPVAPNGVFLNLWSRTRHHNVGWHPHLPSRKCHCLSVVTRRMSRNGIAFAVGSYLQHGVQPTPRLKRPDLLKVFALKKQTGPGLLINCLIGQDSSTVNMRANAIMGLANGIQ